MYNQVSLETQMVKDLPVVQETRVWSLGLENPLENGMATPSSILAWRIPWTEEPGGLQSMESQSGIWQKRLSMQAHIFQFQNNKEPAESRASLVAQMAKNLPAL